MFLINQGTTAHTLRGQGAEAWEGGLLTMAL